MKRESYFHHSVISEDDIVGSLKDRRKLLNRKIIHTIISKSAHSKLLEYGKGQLNTGIETILELLEQRQITVNVQTELVIS